MKKFLLLVSFFVFSILFVACGGITSSSEGTNGGGDVQEYLNCEYDGNGNFAFSNYEKGKLILQINGQEIEITSPSYDVSSLGLEEGVYSIHIYYYVNGEIINQEVYDYQQGSCEGEHRICFFNDSNELIKEVYRPSGSIFEESLFPKYTNKKGVTYSWEHDVSLGSVIEQDIDVYLKASYITYSVTYNLNGGSLGEEAVYSYTINSYYVYYPTPIKDGFVFDGWYESSDFTGNKVNSVNLLNPKNVVVYAKWIELSQETKDAVSVIKEMLKSSQLTMNVTSSGAKYEFAYDNSSTFYFHSITGNNTDYVIIDDIRYSFDNMTYYKEDIDEDNYIDVLSLSNLCDEIVSTSVKTSGSTKTYISSLKHSNLTITMIVKNGQVSKITITDGQLEETYKFTYTCKKISVDASEFTEKVIVKFYGIEIRDGKTNEETPLQGEFKVSKGEKLNEIEFFRERYECLNESFGGIYLDKDRTQEIYFDYVINQSTEIYWVNYGGFTEVLDVYTFTLNVHCSCSECGGVTKTYSDITYSDLTKVKHFENGEDYGLFYVIEDGKHILGWFESPTKNESFVNISRLIEQHLCEGKYYEDLVVDVYTHTEAVETVKVTEVCGCDLHKELGYNEKYIIKGTWYWARSNNHQKDGLMFEKVSLNEDLSSLEDGFLLEEDTTVYYKWIEDTRVNVIVKSSDSSDEGENKLYEKLENLYSRIEMEYSGMYDGKLVEGYYLDKDCTIPFTKDTKVSDGAIIYIKWVKANQINFITYGGGMKEFTIPEGFNVSNYNWDKYIGSTIIEESTCFQDELFNYIYEYSRQNFEYVSVFEFYKDEDRTIKLTSFDNVSEVYLGYKDAPIVTIVCDEACDYLEGHDKQVYNPYSLISSHQISIDDQYYNITYYYDEACTKKMDSINYQYFDEDFAVYGKKSLFEIDYTIYCNCLVHPNGIKGTCNSLIDALEDCDYGFGKGEIIPHLYRDEDYSRKFYIGQEFNYTSLPTLYVHSEGTVTVYCSCDVEGHDGEGFKVVLLQDSEYPLFLQEIERLHQEQYMYVPCEINYYIDENKENMYYLNIPFNDGDTLYIEVNKDENYVPLKLVYGDLYIENIYIYKNDVYYLPTSYDIYNIVGYYQDASYSNSISLNLEEFPYIVPGEYSTIYCKLEVAETVTFIYTDISGNEVEIIQYLIGDYRAAIFYHYLSPAFGYESYVVDSSGNKVGIYDILVENEVYKEKTVKVENYVVITIECDCYNCNYAHRGESVVVLDDGTRAKVVKDNTILVKKGESAVPYIRSNFSYHYNHYYSADIIGMNISLTEDGEPLSKEAFDYIGSIPDEVEYKYIYNQDTTLYFSFLEELIEAL